MEGIIAYIKGKNPTGSPSDEDIFRAATAVYNGDTTVGNMYSYFNDKTLSVGPPFASTLCLQYLRTTHTWKLNFLSKFKPRRAPEILEEVTQSVEDIHAVNRAKMGTKEIGLVLQD